MRKVYWILVFIFLIVLFFVHTNSKFGNIYIGDKKISIEIANTQKKRYLGLGKRNSLCENCGMLFVFPAEGKYSFVMRDMAFPLDFIWIKGGRVEYIVEKINPDFNGIISAPGTFDEVLEVNGGYVEKNGIMIGDVVKNNW